MVPPLRERRGDIPALAEHLLGKITRKLHADAPSLSPPALDLLSTYDWPGNVRELENALTRAAVLARGGPILPAHLALDAGITAGTDPLAPEDRSLAAAERRIIETVLADAGYARVLEISRSRLARMIEKHGLHTPGEFTDP